MTGEATLFDETGTPTHAADPYSSRQAASKAAPRARGQARRILEIIVAYGPEGATTRQIQRALFKPADPAWNKVATRCLDLHRKGLVQRFAATRDDPPYSDQHFLVYAATGDGIDIIRGDTTP